MDVGEGREVIADAGETEGSIRASLDRDAILEYRRDFPALADIHANYPQFQRNTK
jgi:predicted amidohydrolase